MLIRFISANTFSFPSASGWLQTNRLFEGKVGVVDSVRQSRRRDIEIPRPFCERLSFAVVGYVVIYSFVIALLRAGSPAAIFRRVTFFIINAVKRMFWSWTQSHVSEKVFNVFSPTVTNGYAASAVIIKLLRFRVVASLNHVVIDVVFRCITHLVLGVISSRFSLTATARNGCAVYQGECHNFSFGSAFTTTQPPSAALNNYTFADNSPSSKSLIYHSNTIAQFLNLVYRRVI